MRAGPAVFSGGRLYFRVAPGHFRVLRMAPALVTKLAVGGSLRAAGTLGKASSVAIVFAVAEEKARGASAEVPMALQRRRRRRQGAATK